MNYLQIYDDLINKALNEKRKKLKRDNEDYIYYEKHHILPKCLGGLDEKGNYVLLTAREHFIAHKLLVEIFPEEAKLINALWMMSIVKLKKRSYRIGAREYERLKALHIINLVKRNLGSKRSEETKKKMSVSNSGRRYSEETKKKLSELHKGKKRNFTKEHRENLSKALKGRSFKNRKTRKPYKPRIKKWTQVKLEKYAKNFKSKGEFRISDDYAYREALRLKIIDDLFPTRAKVASKWTKLKVKEIAKYCKTRSEFSERSKGAYNWSLRNKFIDELFNSKDKYPALICPHCDLQSRSASNMKRCHFDNCKFNPNNNKEEIEKQRRFNNPMFGKKRVFTKTSCIKCKKTMGVNNINKHIEFCMN